MTKEVMITILNQHGIDALYNVISDELIKKYNYGYDKGYSKGYDDGKEDAYYTGIANNKPIGHKPDYALMDREYNI